MTTIEVRHVSLDAPDGRRLLDDVSLSVASGSRLAVCGPPGAGKTALLRVLVGLDDHTDGDVVIDGTVVNAVGPRQRDMAMVFSDFALHPHLDVYDNLAFAARLRRGGDPDAIDDQVEEVADFLALDHVLEHKPSELDDSQRQRVAIGRALVRDALGYLFDEPFTAQDARVRAHVRSVTTQWQSDRRAHVHLHDVRRPRGAHALGPGGGHAPGLHPSGRVAARSVRPARRPLRRRVPGRTGDEPRPGDRGPDTSCRCPSPP